MATKKQEPTYEIIVSEKFTTKIVIHDVKDDTWIEAHNFFIPEQHQSLNLGFMPPAVRSISSKMEIEGTQSFIVLLEQKPEIKTITYQAPECPTHGLQPRAIVEIPVPWTHFFLKVSKMSTGLWQIQKVGVYFSKTRIMGPAHTFYTPWLLGMYPCVATDTPDLGFGVPVDGKYLSIENVGFDHDGLTTKFGDAARKVVKNFWNDPFLVTDIDDVGPCACGFFNEWHGVKLDDILGDDMFDDAAAAFSYSDYLVWISTVDYGDFSFASKFQNALASGKVTTRRNPDGTMYRKPVDNGEPKFLHSAFTKEGDPVFAVKKTEIDIEKILEKVKFSKNNPSMKTKIVNTANTFYGSYTTNNTNKFTFDESYNSGWGEYKEDKF